MSIAFEFTVQVNKPTDVQTEAERFAFEQVRGTRYNVRDLQIGVLTQVHTQWQAKCVAICERVPEQDNYAHEQEQQP